MRSLVSSDVHASSYVRCVPRRLTAIWRASSNSTEPAAMTVCSDDPGQNVIRAKTPRRTPLKTMSLYQRKPGSMRAPAMGAPSNTPNPVAKNPMPMRTLR